MPKIPISARPGLPAFLIGCITLADLAVARLLLRADESLVYVAGRAVNFPCAFRASTGLPCPTCGMTRSVAMSLHGEFARAWKMAPAGPVAVFGLTALGIAMLALAFLQASGGPERTRSVTRWIRQGALAYVAATTAIWLGGWAVGLRAALAVR